MNVNEFLSKRRKSSLIGVGLSALVLVGTANYFAVGQLLEASVFFLIPVSFLTWFIGRRAGFLAAVASAAIILGTNIVSPIHASHPLVGCWNALIWLGFFLMMTLTVARLKMLYLGEKQLSRLDNLTHIANRLAFYEMATAEKNRAQRFGQPITLAYVDLDGFKEINDAMGHDVGDKLLLWVARTMQKNIRQTDSAARMGGDEFALILPNTTKDAASRVLNKVLQKLNRRMRQNHWPVTFSIGAVTFLAPPDSLQEMIKRADEAMYSAKASGKNRLEQEEIPA
jgi:diguanylate cyclase (GGDEF)-like protein